MNIQEQVQVRINRRCKHVYLRLSVQGEIIVTTPRRLSQKETRDLVEEHRGWLAQQQHKLTQQRDENPQRWAFPPTQIHLGSIGETFLLSQNPPFWIVHQQDRPAEKMLRAADEAQLKKQLQTWVKDKAKHILAKRLQHLAMQCNLQYGQLKIRKMKSRWGSCSREKNICLNQNLIFLPADLVDYVMFHELAHTIHFDHSRKFWQLVKTLQADYRQHDRQLNEESNLIPLWATD